MAFKEEHEIYKRRFGRNVGVGGALLAFVILVFALTIAKTNRGDYNTTGTRAPVSESVAE